MPCCSERTTTTQSASAPRIIRKRLPKVRLADTSRIRPVRSHITGLPKGCATCFFVGLPTLSAIRPRLVAIASGSRVGDDERVLGGLHPGPADRHPIDARGRSREHGFKPLVV